jgi:DNA-directed RNA polymerase subunit beta'
MSEIDGSVKFGNITKGSQKISVTGENGEEREYSVPRGTHINVQEGDYVRAGEPLMDGPLNPHDILAVQGMEALQRYLVNAIQEVYRLQGVHINDKHIEVIVRQMLRWVRIKDVGDTEFLLEEQVDRFRFADENARVEDEDGQQATAEPLLLGITKASLSTDSFISAASFQETTRVLTEAAISGRVDYLRGLKENVIMGRLIPAGTGMDYYRGVKVAHDPTMKDPRAEEMDDTQSYIEQMVAATTARNVPEPDADFDEGFDEEFDGEGELEDILPTDRDFEEIEEEFAELEEEKE